MRKYIPLFILLFFCFGFTSPHYKIIARQNASVGVDNFCDSCPDATAGADLLCEDLSAGDADGLCGWTVSETGGADGDINMAGTPDNDPALGCTDIVMTYAAVVTKTSANSGSAFAYKDISDTENKYDQFYIKFTAWDIATTEFVIFNSLKDATGDPSVWLRVENNAGTYRLNMLIYDDDYIADVGATITLDTWIGIRWLVTNPAGTADDYFQWWDDENNDGTFVDRGSVATNWTLTMDRMMLGITEATTNKATFQISGFKVDDDTMPTGCTK